MIYHIFSCSKCPTDSLRVTRQLSQWCVEEGVLGTASAEKRAWEFTNIAIRHGLLVGNEWYKLICMCIYIYILSMYIYIYGFNTKSWSSMTWMIWGTPILGNLRLSTRYLRHEMSNPTLRPVISPNLAY